jgi:hypothetical protein
MIDENLFDGPAVLLKCGTCVLQGAERILIEAFRFNLPGYKAGPE